MNRPNKIITIHPKLMIDYIDELEKYCDELEAKATPKKPQLEGDGYDNEGNLVYDTWICPNCNEHYEVDYDDYDFCPECGQKLDWSELKNEY